MKMGTVYGIHFLIICVIIDVRFMSAAMYIMADM